MGDVRTATLTRLASSLAVVAARSARTVVAGPFTAALNHLTAHEQFLANCRTVGVDTADALVWLNRANGDTKRAWDALVMHL